MVLKEFKEQGFAGHMNLSKPNITWVGWLAVGLGIGPFVIKRIVLFGEHDYVFWLTIDYVARCISLVGVAIGFCSGLIPRPQIQQGRFGSGLILILLLLAGLTEQAIGYPLLRRYLDYLRLAPFPEIPDLRIRAADAILGVGLVAVSEELVFRRMAFAVIENWSKSLFPVTIASALVFALIHMTAGVAETVNAFVHGLLLGGAFWKSRRISLCIAYHYLIDLRVFGGFLL